MRQTAAGKAHIGGKPDDGASIQQCCCQIAFHLAPACFHHHVLHRFFTVFFYC
jgi:hypothetical protein